MQIQSNELTSAKIYENSIKLIEKLKKYAKLMQKLQEFNKTKDN
jgi:hypothetical protein